MIVFENVLELGAPPGGDEGDGAASFVLLLLAFRASSLRHQCVTKFMIIIILNENKRKLHKIYLKRIFLQLAKIYRVKRDLDRCVGNIFNRLPSYVTVTPAARLRIAVSCWLVRIHRLHWSHYAFLDKHAYYSLSCNSKI